MQDNNKAARLNMFRTLIIFRNMLKNKKNGKLFFRKMEQEILFFLAQAVVT
jgi:hypothetical protein